MSRQQHGLMLKIKPHSKVSIPSIKGVEEAKDWVDNGSKL